MGVVEDIKEEDLKGEVEFVVELDRKELLDIDVASKLESEFALRHLDEREAEDMKIVFYGCDYLIRFPTALSQIVSKKSSVKLLPISKDEFLLKIV
jgi:hypothetical protein